MKGRMRGMEERKRNESKEERERIYWVKDFHCKC